MLTRRRLLASASAAAVCAVSPQADAQSTYARQPVHILVGYPAGGGVDIIARLLQDPMKAAQLEIEHFWAGALRRAVIDGDVDGGSVMAGQSVGMVTKEQPTAEIIQEMIEEALSALADRRKRAER